MDTTVEKHFGKVFIEKIGGNMKRINTKHIFVLLILTVFGIVGFTVYSSVQSKNVERVFVENKTLSLVVESVKELGEKNDQSMVEVSLRNNSDKPISAYRVRVTEEFDGKKEVSVVERGGLIVDWVLKPNEIKVEKFLIKPKGKTHLTIAAVLFEDGTGDGGTADLTRLQEIRVGVRMGFQRIAFILKDTMENESSLSDTAIQLMEEKVKQLSDENVPDKSKPGFALATGYMNIELKDIRDEKSRNSDFNANSKVVTKLAKIESALTKFSINLPPNTGKERRQNED